MKQRNKSKHEKAVTSSRDGWSLYFLDALNLTYIEDEYTYEKKEKKKLLTRPLILQYITNTDSIFTNI